MTVQEIINITTHRHGEMHDITQQVRTVVERSGVANGLVHVFNVGSTASIGTIEYEPGLEEDLPRELDRLLPPGTHYGHEQAWHDGNGHSHLQATLQGPGIIIPVSQGNLVLGTWQQIFHLECDIKPRQRRIVITILGD